jgi:hypothetical protein
LLNGSDVGDLPGEIDGGSLVSHEVHRIGGMIRQASYGQAIVAFGGDRCGFATGEAIGRPYDFVADVAEWQTLQT